MADSNKTQMVLSNYNSMIHSKKRPADASDVPFAAFSEL